MNEEEEHSDLLQCLLLQAAIQDVSFRVTEELDLGRITTDVSKGIDILQMSIGICLCFVLVIWEV